MERIYSSNGLIDEFIAGLNPFNGNPTIYALNESVRKNKVTVSFPQRLIPYLEKKRKTTTDQIQKAILEGFLNHLQSGRIQVVLNPKPLKAKLTIRKSILEDINYATGTSLVIETRLTQKDPVHDLIKLLGCHLFTELNLPLHLLSGLFSSHTLPTISQGTKFSWQTYLRDFVVFTNEITIVDSYILKTPESFTNLVQIVSLFACLPFNHKISLRIITKNLSIPLSEIQDKLSKWINEVRIYKPRPTAEFSFHDRWLITDQWILNSPAGFNLIKSNGKSTHETTPVLYGRYSYSDDIWIQNTGKLESLIQDQCELVK